MALKLKITESEYNALAEGLRELYEENNGSYQLQVDGIEDTSGLTSALKKERESNKEMAKLVKSWEMLGKTPSEISELLESVEQAQNKELAKKGEYDKLLAQVQEKHKAEIEIKQKELEEANRAVESHLIDANAISAITELGGSAKLLLPHVKDRVRVVKDESGQYAVNVLSADKSMPLVNSEGKPIGIKDLLTQMRDDEAYSMAFKPTAGTGTGSPVSTRGGGVQSFKISRADARDGSKYKAVREAAEKAGETVEIID